MNGDIRNFINEGPRPLTGTETTLRSFEKISLYCVTFYVCIGAATRTI